MHPETHSYYQLERDKGIEPSASAWKAEVLPLYESRILVLLPRVALRYDAYKAPALTVELQEDFGDSSRIRTEDDWVAASCLTAWLRNLCLAPRA